MPTIQRHAESSMEFSTHERQSPPSVVPSNPAGLRPATQSTDQQAVPEWLAKPLVDAGMASVEARGLIEFCHRALEQARATVSSVEARYASRLEALNAQIGQKDQEIKSLNQQVEDLQLLVQILERKK
jgi:multidrug resistance efflux pump